MPNYKAHRDITIVSGILALVIFFIGGIPIIGGILFHVGIYLTLWVNPDLDIHQRLGPIGEFIGLEGYKALVPHRYGLKSKHWKGVPIWRVFMFSHIPLLGTLPRAIILTLPVLCLFLAFDSIELFRISWFLWPLLGMSYSDFWHVVADIITSDFKKMTKEYWNEREINRYNRAGNRSNDERRKTSSSRK